MAECLTPPLFFGVPTYTFLCWVESRKCCFIGEEFYLGVRIFLLILFPSAVKWNIQAFYIKSIICECQVIVRDSPNQCAVIHNESCAPFLPLPNQKNDDPLYKKIINWRMSVSEARFSVWCQKSKAPIPTGY